MCVLTTFGSAAGAWIGIGWLLVLLGVVCAVVVSQPRNVLEEDAVWEIYRVEAYENGVKRDITADVKNLPLLAESLRLTQCSRLRTDFAPFAAADVRYEISGTCDGQTLHILLSDAPKLCVVYEDGGEGGWQIRQAGTVLAMVELLCTM